MYTKQVRLVNYGPIKDLDISLPFAGSAPKPVVLVGENGSGKSILLSHIVNGLLQARDTVYPDSPEVPEGKVFKIRSPLYISMGTDFYYGRVDYHEDLYISELQLLQEKRFYKHPPHDTSSTGAEDLWQKLQAHETSTLRSNLSLPTGLITQTHLDDLKRVNRIVKNSCLLYLPSNRFEEPAWLNRMNLTHEAQYMNIEHVLGATKRRVITISPLRDNRDWLLDLLYDRPVLEVQPKLGQTTAGKLTPILTHVGRSQRTYEMLTQLLRRITNRTDARLTVGPRNRRLIGIGLGTEPLVHNIFQSSSGECSLMNLFFSIIRDAELSDISYQSVSDIPGVVVVDEIDLHLHAIHQYEILPKLLSMFPKIQFILTSHSPLFVLGMKEHFGEEGFDLYQLPEGMRIMPEAFSEFGNAYSALTATKRYATEIRRTLQRAEHPVLLVEGVTDIRYIEKAAAILGRDNILGSIGIREGGGAPNLLKVWNGLIGSTLDILSYRILLLFDCDRNVNSEEKGRLFKRGIPHIDGNPVKTGIENLFDSTTLKRALRAKPAFIDITHEHQETIRGQSQTVPESWMVNKDEKANLCTWICDNGTAEDFQAFSSVFDILEDALSGAS